MTVKIKNIIAGMIIAFMLPLSAQAQQSINASGATVIGASGSVSYTIGQVLYATIKDTSGTVSQGVQQTYDISQVGLHESKFAISLAAFPNPTIDQLTLRVAELENEKLNYRFCDIQGKIILSGTITSTETLLNMEGIKAATYFIYITDEQNHSIQTFKIIKK